MLLAAPGAAAQSGIEYLYDELGRLKAVIAPDGERAEYNYDDAGNLTGIRPVGSGALTISEFTPNIGPADTVVTISGAGFSTTAANNTVRFNGTAATVVTATAKRLQVTAPTGGTSGPISVTVAAVTATSSEHFTYATDGVFGPPTITGFMPDNGPAGTAVTIAGTNFDTAATRVSFNGNVAGQIVSLTATQIVARVPFSAGSGPIAALTPRGIAVSASDFIVTPPGYAFADIVARQRATVDGAPITLNINAINKHGLALFTGVQGQFLSVQISAFNTSPANQSVPYKIFDPNNVQFAAGSVSPTARTIHLPRLPKSGTYSLFFSPGNATASLTFAITRDAALSIEGAATTANVEGGQSIRYLVNGTVGQWLGLGVSGLATTPSGGSLAVTVYKPDGGALGDTGSPRGCAVQTWSAPGNRCVLRNLPVSGIYTVVVDPRGINAALSLTLSSDVSAELAPNGASLLFSTARVGQNGRYTFNGVAGQSYSVLWSGSSFAGNWSIYVYKPDGTELTNRSFDNGMNPGGSGTLDLSNLPASGVYTVFVTPFRTATGQMSVALKSDDVGMLEIDGAVKSVSLAAGQNGRYSFTGTMGQWLGLGVSGFATTPSGGSLFVTVYKPDGGALGETDSPRGCAVQTWSAPGNRCVLRNLPISGIYTVVVDPGGTNAATLSLTLSSDVSAELAPNGASLLFSTARVGQNARYTFNGVAGQSYSVLWSGNNSFAGFNVLYVYRPDGAVLENTIFGAPAGTLDLSNVPASGVYTVFVTPEKTSTGQVTVALKSDDVGTLEIDGAAKSVSLAAGQNGRYSFTGTMGQWLGLGVSGFATTPSGGSLSVTVYKPNGTALSNTGSPRSCAGAWSAPGGRCVLRNLPVSGIYTVVVDPGGTNAATLSLTLSSDVSAELAPNGASLLFSTARVGQNARYTFNGVAGQSYSVLWSGSSFASAWSYIYVYKPDGTELRTINFNGGGNANGTLDLNNVPASGTYTVFVTPEGTSTGQVTVALKSDDVGTLEIDGAVKSVSLAAGQNGRYSFTGTMGQWLGLGVSGFATTPSGGSLFVTVYKPDGGALGETGSPRGCARTWSAPGNRCVLRNLPISGIYTVVVDPGGTNAATLSLTLSSDVSAELAPNGASLLFSTARVGQNARYTFNGVAGQSYSVLWSGSSFASLWNTIYVYKPDGSELKNIDFDGAGSANGTLDLSNVPASGVYTVFVTPEKTSTGQVTVALKSDDVGTLEIDGAAKSVSLAAGQNGRYSFTGTMGQWLGLGVSGFATTPSGGSLSVTVYKPDGTALSNTGSPRSCAGPWSAPGGRCVLRNLPVSGIYTVVVDPGGTNAATLSLTLSSDVSAELAPNGASLLFSTARVGQNARYTFNGVAGQSYSVLWSGSSFASPTSSTWSYIYVYKPDGTELRNINFNGGGNANGTLDLNNVPASGVYTVFVTPYGTAIGQVSVVLKRQGASLGLATAPLPSTAPVSPRPRVNSRGASPARAYMAFIGSDRANRRSEPQR